MTAFVVVNESEHPIEVSYKYKHFPGDKPFELYERPAKIAADRLSSRGGNEWQELTPSDYQLDRENRTVLVRVMPREALRIYRFHDYRGHEDAQDEGYPLEEISVLGASGGLKYTGQQARTAFSEVSRALYTLTYK
jgi:hypothetical protein